MKSRLWFVSIILFAWVLAACQTAQPVVTQSPTTAAVSTVSADVTQPTAAGAAYPAPQQAVAVATQAPAAGSASVLYPGPKDGDQVSWPQVAAMILNHEVAKIIHPKPLEITITLKDGRSLTSFEPSEEELQGILQKCGDACKDISIDK
ncbi:MAG TPA: hypothetical protein VF823_10345 [Anaerolineales bacterium]